MMSDRTTGDMATLLQRKRAWHQEQAAAPLREKVNLLT